MFNFGEVFRNCLTNLAYNRPGIGEIELYDNDERRRVALINLKLYKPHYSKLGEKYKKFAMRVERRALMMQETINFVMKRADSERRVKNADELLKAFDEGYELSTEELNFDQNPCAEIKIGPGMVGNPGQSGTMTYGGSPYSMSLTPAQLRLIGRAVWQRLHIVHRDSVIIEALPHIKISKSVFTKLRNEVVGTPATELLFAFYNQYRQPQWWTEFRNYGRPLRDANNRQIYAKIVAEYLWDGIGPKTAINPQWKTSTVISMLRIMRETEDFSPMPILADALQDAGCHEEKLLAHYRNPNASFSLGSWIFRATGIV